MPNEKDSNDPATKPQAQPPRKPPVTPPAPLQGALHDNGKRKSDDVKNEADELAREFRAAEKWVIGTNITLIIIGVVALCIYHGQLNQMIESNKIGHDSLVAVQRAFIHFDHIVTTGIMTQETKDAKPSRVWTFDAAAENNGNTPAIEVVNAFSVVDHAVTEEEFLALTKKQDLRKTVVGPKAPLYIGPQNRTQEFLFGQGVLNPGSKFTTVKIERTVLFLGWIAYRDVLPKTPLHITEFCQELTAAALHFDGTPPKIMPQYPKVDFHFAGCAEHNCTDEYCRDYQQLVTLVLSQPTSGDPFGIEKTDRKLNK